MSLPIFHALSFMFLYFKDKRRFDPLALVVSSTFIDLEPLYYFLVMKPINHRALHGFALALTIYPVLVSLGLYAVEYLFTEKLQCLYGRLKLGATHVRYPILTIYFCSLLGGFTHIFFDMFTHENMPYVVYPVAYGNLFYLGKASVIVELIITLLAVYSLLLCINERRKSLKGYV